jgi:hypothetical protein
MKDVVFLRKCFYRFFFPFPRPKTKTLEGGCKKNNRVGVQKNNEGTPVDVLLDATQHEHVLLGFITTTCHYRNRHHTTLSPFLHHPLCFFVPLNVPFPSPASVFYLNSVQN